MIPLLEIRAAADAVRAGRLVALPTETVYGLGADALNPEAVVKIFQAKGRPRFNPIICHLPDAETVFRYGRRSPAAERLAAFWPGPLTLLLPHDGRIPSIVTAGSPLAGFRVPDHDLALAFLRACGTPVAAPSANRSGRRSPTTAAMVQSDYADAEGGAPHENETSGAGPGPDKLIAGILDGGPSQVGLESTVVAIDTEDPPTVRVLRPGGIAREALEQAGFRVVCDSDKHPDADQAGGDANVSPEKSPLHAPGRLLKHYGPGVPLLLLKRRPESAGATVAAAASRAAVEAALGEINPDAEPVVWLGFAGRRPPLPCAEYRDLSPAGDPAEAARALFAQFDAIAAASRSVILCETLPDAGLGLAVNDRLTRAATRIIPSRE